MTLVYPRDLDKARLRSLMAESLAACDARQLAALDEPLETLRKAHPEDLSIAIAIALKALASGDSKQIAPALDGLNRLVEQTPLEPLPPGGRANARQRAEAARQVPLWLVARACAAIRRERPARHGRPTGRAAIEAARRQADNLVLLAMLREQGELALTHGDSQSRRGRLGPDARNDPARPAGAGPPDRATHRRTGPAPAGIDDAPRAVASRCPHEARGALSNARLPDGCALEPSGMVFAPKRAEPKMETQ